MHYNIIDNQRKQNCIEFIQALNLKEYCVLIKPLDVKRTLKQNNLCHMWLAIIAKDQGITPDMLKDEVKIRLGLYEVKTIKDRDVLKLKSTAQYTKQEMTNYIRSIESIAQNLNIVLPYPDDYNSLVCQF